MHTQVEHMGMGMLIEYTGLGLEIKVSKWIV